MNRRILCPQLSGPTCGIILILFLGSNHVYGQYEGRILAGHSLTGEPLDSARTYEFWLATLGVSRHLASIGNHTVINGVLDVHFAAASTRSEGKRDFDLALNLTIEVVWELSPSLGFQAGIGSGPAYHSTVSHVQARGFVFSNHFIAGLRVPLFGGRVLFNPQGRFRHLSNASTRKPNKGIDNFIATLGVCVPFR